MSVSESDLALLDEFVEESGLPSRSAGIQQAIRRLRDSGLEADYAAACQEWASAGDEAAWEATSADGFAKTAP